MRSTVSNHGKRGEKCFGTFLTQICLSSWLLRMTLFGVEPETREKNFYSSMAGTALFSTRPKRSRSKNVQSLSISLQLRKHTSHPSVGNALDEQYGRISHHHQYCNSSIPATPWHFGSLEEVPKELRYTDSERQRKERSRYVVADGERKTNELKDIVDHHILRRLRKDHLSDRLPKKEDFVVFAPYSSQQGELMEKELQRIINRLECCVGAFPVISDLRKICRHPMLKTLEGVGSILPYLKQDNTNELISQCPKLGVGVDLAKKFCDEGHSTLLFSHSTKTLDIIQHVMKSKGILFERIDGSTETKQRQKKVDMFNKSLHATVFLLSTKAAGLGLTITGLLE